MNQNARDPHRRVSAIPAASRTTASGGGGGWGSGRDVLEEGGGGGKGGGSEEGGGGGFGWDPPPPPRVPLWSPAEGGPKVLRRKSAWHRRRRSKNVGLAVSLKHWKGRSRGTPPLLRPF